MRLHNRKYLKLKRRELRNNQTFAERHLWRHLRKRQLEGRRFLRQHSIGNYIVDFYCASEKLIVELDGESHFTKEAQQYDAERTEYLTGLGFKIIRFDNLEVYYSTDYVLKKIRNAFISDNSKIIL